MKKIFKKIIYVYLIILLILIGLEVSPIAPTYKANPWINQSEKPWIIPHGGAKEL